MKKDFNYRQDSLEKKLRKFEVLARRCEGETLKSIGETLGISPSRVHQLDRTACRMVERMCANAIREGYMYPYNIKKAIEERDNAN